VIYPRRGLVLTHSRQCADFADPSDTVVDIRDIEFGLSGMNRYNAQVRVTVLVHSVLVLELARIRWPHDLETHAHAAGHDLHETYLPDIPKPLKRLIPEYEVWETRWMQHVHVASGLQWPVPPAVQLRVDEVDVRAVIVETASHPDADHFQHYMSEPACTAEELAAYRFASSLSSREAIEHVMTPILAYYASRGGSS
jgi:hypothetical protein